MNLKLFFLLYLSGLVTVTFSVLQPSSDLYFIQSAVSWSAAQTYCRMKYTDLARAKTDSTLLKLKEMAASNGVTWPVWIGLYNDNNSWCWSFNNFPLTSATLINWNTGQPNNSNGKEACGGISSSGYWEDWDCTTLNPFICYNASNSGAEKFVGVSTPQMTWSEAQTYCRTYHTDLASALDQTDNNLLGQVASVQGFSWFGLHSGTWKWLNRTVALNLQWGSGQPDNSGTLENCGFLQNGLFGDEPCGNLHYFFCESIPPVRRQIVRLLVKFNGSVFDPSVQSSILEKIKQKIEQHGMLESTTVTWRVEPDGNIFNKKDDGI